MLADRVFDWLSGLPDWQRDLARRLAGQLDLGEDEYAEALAMVRAAFGLPAKAPLKPSPVEREHIAAAANSDDVRLLGIGSLQGVGLVNEDEELTFAEDGLTVIYGQNAAGKSSYVRVLKKLCRTVDRDCRIRGSIYEDAATRPSARIDLKVNGALTAHRTSLDTATAERIPGMTVFDSACAELYVDSQNDVQYVPSELHLLARLAMLQDRMRQDLAHERELLQLKEPSCADYPADTAVGQALRRLTGEGTDADLDLLSALDAAQMARLSELRLVVATAQTSTAKTDAAAAEREANEAEELAAEIEDLVARGSTDRTTALRDAVVADREAQQAVEVAARELAGPVPGVGGGPWKLMWEAARDFVASGGSAFPPAAGGPCPLCLQTVSSDAAERFVHFQNHVSGSVQATATRLSKQLSERLDAAGPAHADRLSARPLLATLREHELSVATIVDDVILQMRDALAAIVATPETAESTRVDGTAAAASVREWGNSRLGHARALREADDTDKLPGLRRELADLEGRKRLADNLQLFKDWQLTRRTMTRIDAVRTALATNRLTTAQRSLVEDGLGKELEAALNDELKNLSCALPVQMHAHTARAEISIALRLMVSDPPKVSEIVSEGERRALALCFFLAELSVANDRGGVVLDDPVSSLDDERRTYVVERLVREAADRQVIVFTHDLPFVFELRTNAKSAGRPVHVQHVWRQGQDVGRVDEQPPFKTMDLKARVNRLNEELQEMRKSPPRDSDDAWRQVDGFYMRLRTSWERAVEERLFGGVVERFERDVRTLRFRYIKVTPERIKIVEHGMTRASRFVHDDAFGAQVPLPSIREMAEDLEVLRNFERETRADS